MIARPITIAFSLAALIATPVVTLYAQAQQQQQQQVEQRSGAIATVALATNLTRAEIVGDSTAPTFASKAKVSLSLVPASKEVCYEVDVADLPNVRRVRMVRRLCRCRYVPIQPCPRAAPRPRTISSQTFSPIPPITTCNSTRRSSPREQSGDS
jgi:hypothetical protein